MAAASTTEVSQATGSRKMLRGSQRGRGLQTCTISCNTVMNTILRRIRYGLGGAGCCAGLLARVRAGLQAPFDRFCVPGAEACEGSKMGPKRRTRPGVRARPKGLSRGGARRATFDDPARPQVYR